MSNNCAKESRFVKDVDDQSHSGIEVKNFMIGPVFGTDDSNNPIAIIQFINKYEENHEKKTLVNIEDIDRAKFKSMQKLLGMCVDNTNDMSNTIKMSFDVHDIMKRINAQLSEDQGMIEPPELAAEDVEMASVHISGTVN